MSCEINFEPLGYLKGNIPPLFTPHTRCVKTEMGWNKLWSAIMDAGVNAEVPKVDFANRMVIHIRGSLSSISDKFLVKTIVKLADDTLEVHCGKVSSGSGLGFAAMGTSNVFVTIDRTVAFNEIKTKAMAERRLEDFDEDLCRFQNEIETLGIKEYETDKAFREQYGTVIYAKVRDVKRESEVDEIEGIDETCKELLKAKVLVKQRYEKVSSQYSKQYDLVLERVAGESLRLK